MAREKTGIFDKNGKEICVGDVVHYRGEGMCAQPNLQPTCNQLATDCISRQAAITLPVMPKEHREYQTYNLDDAYEQGWYDLQECIEKLPSAQPEQRWIPCSERLPEEYKRVLVSDVFGVYVGEFVDAEENWGGEHFINEHGMHSKSVTAWMPLPEPYRKGADNEID